MKNKLRKIVVDNIDYRYYVSFNEYEYRGGDMVVKIFLNGNKTTPLVLHFLTFIDPIKGHPLNNGIDLFNRLTQSKVRVNIHEPKYIRELILEGVKRGWTGSNHIDKQNGIDYLTTWGFDTSSLVPH
ncbi:MULTISPECIES: hypothetical protein [unclassified Chitinophaga]|uniref:hypothetical protein n=1 Tax=unclassified Chitinophaga TaxID=2619133 RepID=UPI00300FD182